MAQNAGVQTPGQVGRLTVFIARFISRQGFVALMVASALALSAASFFNTYKGMTEYMGNPVMTSLIAFGLQGIMFAMAWIIAQWMGTGHGRVLMMLAAFTACALVSISFSFSALFNFIYTQNMRDQANLGFMRRFYQQAVGDLEKAQMAKLEATHNALVASAEFKEWDADLQQILVLAQNVPEVLGARIAENAAEADRLVTRTIESIATTKSGLTRAKAAVATHNATISRVNGEIAQKRDVLNGLNKESDDLEVRVAALEGDMKLELEGVGSAAGDGPKYRLLKAERDTLFRELSLKKVTLSSQDERVRGLEEQLGIAETALSEATAEQARLSSILQQGEARLTEISAKVQNGGTQSTGALDPKAAMQQISEGIQAASRSASGFGQVTSQVIQVCESLRAEMLPVPELAQSLDALACRSAGFQAGASELAALDDALVAFRSVCNPSEFATGSTNVEVFESAVQKIETCLSQSGADVADARQELATLVSSRGPDAHPFVVAQTALFVDKLPLSYMALFLAVIIDVLVLAAALLAELVGQSRRHRALRALSEIRIETIDSQPMPVVTLDATHGLYKAIRVEAHRLQFLGHGRLLTVEVDGATVEKLVLLPSAFNYLNQQIALEGGAEETAALPQPSPPETRSFP